MAHSHVLESDFIEYVKPLCTEILNYELRIRGVQPAQAVSIKRMQLARELLNEHNQSKESPIYFFLSPDDDLRECAALSARFEASLTNISRDANSIETAFSNLVMLERRIRRIQCVSFEQSNMAKIILTNIQNAMAKAKVLINPNAPNYPGLIDFSDDEEVTPSVTNTNINSNNLETGVLNQLFASVDINSTRYQPQPAPRRMNNYENSFGFGSAGTNNNNYTEAQPVHRQSDTYNLPNRSLARNQTFCQNNGINYDPSIQHEIFAHHDSRQMPNFSNFNRNVPFASTHSTSNFMKNNSNTQAHNAYAQSYTQPTSYGKAFGHSHQSQQQNTRSSFARRIDHKIYKWNVKFSGEEKSSNAIDFIQKVNALAQSRGVSETDLFESAIEFFSGHALKWYFSQRDQLSSWDQIAEKLVSDFVEVDYYDKLLMKIHQRKQSHDESVVHFITIFEDDCSRLITQLTSAEKVNILKRNILQKYRPSIILREYGTVDELKHELKLLESTMQYDRNVHFSRNDSRSHSFRDKSPYRQNDDKTNHRSRYDKYENSRNRSSSSQSNISDRDQSRSKYESFKRRTPTPAHNHSRENSHDRNRSFSRDRNNSRSNDRNRSVSRDNAKQFKPKPSQKHLNA